MQYIIIPTNNTIQSCVLRLRDKRLLTPRKQS